jgi:hypothetical protein
MLNELQIFKEPRNTNERCAIWQYLQGSALLGDAFQGLRFAPPRATLRSTPGYFMGAPSGPRIQGYPYLDTNDT